MAQSDKHHCLLLDLASDETPDSPQLNLEKTSCSKSATGTTRNENRRFLPDMVVKTFGRLYNEFLPTKRSNMQENGVREAHEVATRQGDAPSKGGRALHPRGGLVSFPDYFLLP